jgi:hypothetical protein
MKTVNFLAIALCFICNFSTYYMDIFLTYNALMSSTNCIVTHTATEFIFFKNYRVQLQNHKGQTIEIIQFFQYNFELAAINNM